MISRNALFFLVFGSLSACQTTPVQLDVPSIQPSVTTALDTPTQDGATTADLSTEATETSVEETITIVDESDLFWAEVRRGFRIAESEAHNERVKPHQNWYQSREDFLHRVTGRAEPYLYYIHEEIQKRGLPSELLLLPIVESAYIPEAYSRSRAAGIWQFIPSTGRYFGLKQNWWYDGRRDIIESTHAALDYLTRLNKRFDGDWLLALAAYNAGEGTIERALKRNRDKGLGQDFWSLSLRRETMDYVPKLLAVTELVRHSDTYGMELWPVNNSTHVVPVELDGQIELDLAAGLAGISMDELKRLNPGYQRWATDPDGPYHLLLPEEKAPLFETRLAKIPLDQRVRWHRHRVRDYETLSHISVRYGTRLSVLKKANNLTNDRIRVGQHLLVPQGVTKVAQLTQHHVPDAFLEATDASKHRHVVEIGDTYWGLSRQYKVSIDAIASWNQLNTDDPLIPGQSLTLWLAKGDGAQTAQSILANTSSEAEPTRSVKYSVRRGDTLYSIARRFALKIADIRDWNDLVDDRIHPGQALTLYVQLSQQYLGTP